MSKGNIGYGNSGQMGGPSTMESRSMVMPPDFGAQTMELKYPQFGPGFGNMFEPQPGYQQPMPQQPNQGQQQQQQYFQQMHKNMEDMNQALGQIEQMKMPGQQYGGGNRGGGMFGGGKGKGGINF